MRRATAKRIATRLLLAPLVFLPAGCTLFPVAEPERDLAALDPAAYRLDPAHTAVLFKVDHLGLSRFVGRFENVDATLDFDPNDPGAARLDVIVQTGSIDVVPADFADTLAGPDWFDAARFPEARFRSTSVEALGGDRWRVDGEFRLLGVARPLSLEVVFNGGAFNAFTGRYTVGFRAAATLQRSAFGLDAHVPAVGDEVELEIHAEFQRLTARPGS
jgi:polyisoprenoid-binding protein YceI